MTAAIPWHSTGDLHSSELGIKLRHSLTRRTSGRQSWALHAAPHKLDDFISRESARGRRLSWRNGSAAVTDYDLGYSLEQTAARLNKKTGQHVSTSTIAAWLEQYKSHCSYRRLRSRGLPSGLERQSKGSHNVILGGSPDGGTDS